MKHIGAALVFLGILFMGLHVLNLLCYEPQLEAGQWNGWSLLERHSVDVLFLGNSHAECSVAPMQLFKETGIKSWTLKSAGCNMPVRYYYLREALKTQRPKVVAIEAYTGELGRRLNDGQNLGAYGWMPFGLNRVLSASITATPTTSMSYAIPLVAEHSKLFSITKEEITQKIFKANNLQHSFAGGKILFQPLTQKEALKYRPWSKKFPQASQSDYEFQLTYLRKIVQLSQNKGARVIVWLAPTQFINQEAYLTRLKRDLRINTKGVTFINLNNYQQEIGLTEGDFRDDGHLFMWGAKKTTSWFGTYLLGTKVNWDNKRGNEFWKRNVDYWDRQYSLGIQSQ